MNMNEVLSTKQKHLIGEGAAVAAGCHPCTSAYVAAAKAEGACDRGIRLSIERGIEFRDRATAALVAFSDTTFAKPELDAAFREGRSFVDALIGVAAAVAGNSSVSVEPSVKAARDVGATDAQIRMAIQIGRTTRRGAENATESSIASVIGDEDTARCCEGDRRSVSCSSEANAPARPSESACNAVGPCSANVASKGEYETVHIEKTTSGCSLCEDFAKQQSHKPVVVMSCEGACLRGEISRQAANHLCFELMPEKTVRLCLGGAFTKDAGQRALVRNAKKVLALEGCSIRCASRMMRGHFPNLDAEVIVTDKLCKFDPTLFGVDALAPEAIRELGQCAAAEIHSRIS